jgi:hypothetical protein
LEKNNHIEQYLQNDFLLDYIHHRLSNEDRVAFEQHLATNEMLQDALEGLQIMDTKKDLPHVQAQLHDFLQHQTYRNHYVRKKPNFNFVIWTSIAIFLLLICLMGMYIYSQKST